MLTLQHSLRSHSTSAHHYNSSLALVDLSISNTNIAPSNLRCNHGNIREHTTPWIKNKQTTDPSQWELAKIKLISIHYHSKILKRSGHTYRAKQVPPSWNTQEHTVLHRSTEEESSIKGSFFLKCWLSQPTITYTDRNQWERGWGEGGGQGKGLFFTLPQDKQRPAHPLNVNNGWTEEIVY